MMGLLWKEINKVSSKNPTLTSLGEFASWDCEGKEGLFSSDSESTCALAPEATSHLTPPHLIILSSYHSNLPSWVPLSSFRTEGRLFKQ